MYKMNECVNGSAGLFERRKGVRERKQNSHRNKLQLMFIQLEGEREGRREN